MTTSLRGMATMHIAGTSCTAFSSQGRQKGIRDATILPFLAWVSLRVLVQEPVIIHENSIRFPISLLERFLGHLYIISESNVDAANYGAPVHRQRKLTRLFHRQKIFMLLNDGLTPDAAFSLFSARFHRGCAMLYHAFYFLHMMQDDESKAGYGIV